ncbi:hypothetical protein JTB14_019300 [Gonioctena quinquepunctata]|nr:hypothetical protein JTB14_019300 [Gonioctena quinquepunctata]
MEVSDEWIGTIMLAGLPGQYGPMIIGLENAGTKITADSIKIKLIQDISDFGKDSSEKSAAMYSHWNRGQSKSVSATSSSDSSSSNNDTRRGRGLRCYKCNGYYGHIAKNCDRVPDNDNGDKREKTKSDRAFFITLCVQGSL